METAFRERPRHEGDTREQREMLAQRIFSTALGHEDLNDQNELRTDPALQLAADWISEEDDPLASASTLCRLENRIGRKTLVKLSALFVERVLAAHPTPPEEIVLDFAATDDPIHDRQQHAFFEGDYRNDCFLPLYVFCDSHLLCALLRLELQKNAARRFVLHLCSTCPTQPLFRHSAPHGSWLIPPLSSLLSHQKIRHHSPSSRPAITGKGCSLRRHNEQSHHSAKQHPPDRE